jgi:hypothetical protein
VDVAADLGIRGATQVETFDVDFTTAAVPSTLAAMADKLGGLDHVILAYGVLGGQGLAERDLAPAQVIIDVPARLPPGALPWPRCWSARAGLPGGSGVCGWGSWTPVKLHLWSGQGRPGDLDRGHQSPLPRHRSTGRHRQAGAD